MKLTIAVAAVLALGAVAAAVYVGSRTAESTVVDHPYERGLRYDEERAGGARLGLRAAFDPASLHPGGEALDFALLDRSGAPVEAAAVQVSLNRPAGGGGEASAAAVGLGAGRYRAPLGFAGPGFWDVRLDVSRGHDLVGLTQQVRVEAAAASSCDLAAGACAAEAGGIGITLDLGRTLVTMSELPAVVELRRAGAPVEGAAVELAFAMRDMNMGENRLVLAAAGPGRHEGKAVLIRCHSGSRAWIASVTVRVPGAAPISAQFPFTVQR